MLHHHHHPQRVIEAVPVCPPCRRDLASAPAKARDFQGTPPTARPHFGYNRQSACGSTTRVNGSHQLQSSILMVIEQIENNGRAGALSMLGLSSGGA